MKKRIAAILATTLLASGAFADGYGISEFRIGILGGENAQDRLNTMNAFGPAQKICWGWKQNCLRQRITMALFRVF